MSLPAPLQTLLPRCLRMPQHIALILLLLISTGQRGTAANFQSGRRLRADVRPPSLNTGGHRHYHLTATETQLTLDAPESVMVGEQVKLQVSGEDGPVAGAEIRVVGPTRTLAVVTATGGLNVRTEPSGTAPSKGLIYPDDGTLLILSTTADGWHNVVLQSGDTGYVASNFTDEQPYGQPLGTTDEQGILVTNKLAVAPSSVEVAATVITTAVSPSTTSVTVKVAPYQYDHIEEVAPGVTYRERRFVRESSDLFTMQILEVDPANPYVDLLPVLANDKVIDKETTSSMARRYGATAAINGGYFTVSGSYAGDPSGVYMLNKQVISDGSRRTALLLCSEERHREQAEMDIVSFSGKVTAGDGAALAINVVNGARGANQLVLFRPIFGPSTRTDASGVEVILDAEHQVVSIEDRVGNAGIPTGGVVLSGSGTAAAWLREHVIKGSPILVEDRLIPRVLQENGRCSAQDVIGGGPRLVTDGVVTVNAPGEDPFSHEQTRNPRTAFGVTNSGTFIFVTVDGRQPNRSVGMRLDELAAEMIELEAVQALNLDGGGSTTMVVNDRVRNSPSDASSAGRVEREVSDGVLIFSKGDLGGLARLLDRLIADPNQIDPGVAPRLRKKLHAAIFAKDRGRLRAASNRLQAMRQIIDAKDGNRLSNQAAELMRETIDAITELWQADVNRKGLQQP